VRIARKNAYSAGYTTETFARRLNVVIEWVKTTRIPNFAVAIALVLSGCASTAPITDPPEEEEKPLETSATDSFNQKPYTDEDFIPGQDLEVNFVFVIDTSISMTADQIKVSRAAADLFDIINLELPGVGTVRVSAITSSTFKSPNFYVGDLSLHNPDATTNEKDWETTYCGDPEDLTSPYNRIPSYCIDWVANGFNGMTPKLDHLLTEVTYSDGTYLTGDEADLQNLLLGMFLRGAGTSWLEPYMMPILMFLDNDTDDLALKNPTSFTSFVVVGDADDSSDIHNNPGDGFIQNCRDGKCHGKLDSRIDNGDTTDVSNYANYQGIDVGPTNFVYDYLMNAKPDPRLISLNSITGIPGVSVGCVEFDEITFRKLQDRWRDDHGVGGVEGDICEPDYEDVVSSIATDAVGQLSKQYNLTGVTENYADNYFTVSVDGSILDPTTYTLTIDFENEIFLVLLDDAPPSVNSNIVISYLNSQLSYQLSKTPVISSIEVNFIDDDGAKTLVPASEYSYDKDSKSVIFNDLNFAGPDQKFTVDYEISYEE
jgi:hypothetical protein